MQQKKEINIEIGLRVQAVREKRGLTQEQFAELLGVGVQHVSKIERGVTGMSLTSLKSTCEILQVSADYLLRGIGPIDGSDNLLWALRDLPSGQAELTESGIRQLLQALHLANQKDL